jgi:hypothetical protein
MILYNQYTKDKVLVEDNTKQPTPEDDKSVPLDALASLKQFPSLRGMGRIKKLVKPLEEGPPPNAIPPRMFDSLQKGPRTPPEIASMSRDQSPSSSKRSATRSPSLISGYIGSTSSANASCATSEAEEETLSTVDTEDFDNQPMDTSEVEIIGEKTLVGDDEEAKETISAKEEKIFKKREC